VRRKNVALRSGLSPREPLALYFLDAAFDELDDLGVAYVQVERILGDEKA
jgi:hypothetical protein